MANLAAFRDKFPESDSMSDREFADYLYQNHYKDKGNSKDQVYKLFNIDPFVDIPKSSNIGSKEVREEFITNKREGFFTEIAKAGYESGKKAYKDTGEGFTAGVLGLLMVPPGVVAGAAGEAYNTVARTLGIEESGDQLRKDLMAGMTETIFPATGAAVKVALVHDQNQLIKRAKELQKVEDSIAEGITKSTNIPSNMKSILVKNARTAFQRRITQTADDAVRLKEQLDIGKKALGTNTTNQASFLIDLFQANDISLDLHRYKQQLVEGVITGKLDATKITPYSNKYKLTPKDIKELMPGAKNAPEWVKLRNEFGVFERSVRLAEATIGTSRSVQWADYYHLQLDKLLKDMEGNSLVRAWQTFDRPRKMAMTGQMATSMRNALGGTVNVGMNTLSNLFEATYRSLDPAATSGWKHFGNSLEYLVTAQSPAVKKAMDGVLASYPYNQSRLMQTIAPDIQSAFGVIEPQSMVYKVTKGILTSFNMAQEKLFRRYKFMEQIDRTLIEKGFDPRTVIQDPAKLRAILTDADVTNATEKALDFTFANEPINKNVLNLVRTINKTPATLAVPFSRFMTQAFKFMGDYSTKPFWDIATSLTNGKVDHEALGKLTTGLTALYIGHQIVNDRIPGIKHGPQWYNLQSEDGTIIDIRAYAPFSFPVWLADLVKRQEEGTLPNKENIVPYILEGSSGLNARLDDGISVYENLVSLLRDPKFLQTDVNKLEVTAGGIASQFLTPLQSIKDVYSYFDQEEAIIKDKRINPFLSNVISSIPFGKDIYRDVSGAKQQPKINPFDVDSPTMRDSIIFGPAGIQLTGIRKGEKLGFTTEAMVNLGLPSFPYSPRTGLPQLDNVIMLNLEQLMPLIDEYGKKMWKEKATKEEKVAFLENNLDQVAKISRGVASGNQKDIEKFQAMLGGKGKPYTAPVLASLYSISLVPKEKRDLVAQLMPKIWDKDTIIPGMGEKQMNIMKQVFTAARQDGIDLKVPEDYRAYMIARDKIERLNPFKGTPPYITP